MSTGYTVVVPHERWPSNAAMQASLDARGYPVALVGGAPDAPFAVGSRGLELRLDGRSLTLVGASAAKVGAAAFARDETNDVLAGMGAAFRARDGDWHFGVGLGSEPREWRAAFLVMAALVQDFGGYGYETQTESHGDNAWAAALIEDAEQFRLQAAATPAAVPQPDLRLADPGGWTQEKTAGVVCVALGGAGLWVSLSTGNLLISAIGVMMVAMGVAVFFIRRKIA
ncbi:hypothetical protein [Sphingomonas sp. LM7]|uniref:hypothetical protein n=1 Tax=Sphingomonas sp. LM7 TaxID=1938607 RepID=UPI000983DE43|nr:hypothetical protein [Sphingomonas sp. LM7]AQR75157.1 hypothetical protein BXU08_17165 [Sphingomonas sp. LM7]